MLGMIVVFVPLYIAQHNAIVSKCFHLDSALQSPQNYAAIHYAKKMQTIGKYEIVSELGTGATSTVYLATDPFSGQQVAIKLFDLKNLRNTNTAKVYRKLLMTEASLAGKLNHPHIVKILDAVLEDDLNYMVMEYVAGTTLEQYGEVDNLLPISTVAEIAYKCCKALEYAQHQGVIHRDIKPANILFFGESDIKISDFGAATLVGSQTTQVTGIGSPAYMSPEQVKELKVNHQTDIYSLGATLYKLLTGKLPFDASNNHSMMYHIINIDPPPPSSFRPETPVQLDAIVLRAMEKDVAKRYQTWEEFAHDLVSFSSHVVTAQGEIFDTEKFDVLRSLVFFKNFSDVELWETLRISRWRKVLAQEHVLHDGERGCCFYIMAQGTVRVSKKGRLFNLLHRGDCFGEMAHFVEHNFKRSTDVIAKTDAVLIEIDPDVLMHATTDCRFQFGDAFLRMLMKRLSIANTRISYLLADHNQENEE
jgi:serine/threonine protein kinase